MACVSACIHYYPFVIGQHYTALYSWAIEGLASVDTAYSQEASRLLTLLSTDTPSWDKTVHKLCDELNFLTATGFAPATTQGQQMIRINVQCTIKFFLIILLNF